MEERKYTCSICGTVFTGFGNNPWPVTRGEDDECCDICNATYVIPARLCSPSFTTEQEVEEDGRE